MLGDGLCVYEGVYVWWVCGEGMSVLGAMCVHVCSVCMWWVVCVFVVCDGCVFPVALLHFLMLPDVGQS